MASACSQAEQLIRTIDRGVSRVLPARALFKVNRSKHNGDFKWVISALNGFVNLLTSRKGKHRKLRTIFEQLVL